MHDPVVSPKFPERTEALLVKSGRNHSVIRIAETIIGNSISHRAGLLRIRSRGYQPESLTTWERRRMLAQDQLAIVKETGEFERGSNFPLRLGVVRSGQ